MIPELLYEIYKYLSLDNYIGLKEVETPHLNYLINAFRGPYEAKLILPITSSPESNKLRFLTDGINHLVRVNPAIKFNLLISWASRKGYSEVVKRLLADDRVDSSKINNLPVRGASAYGHLEVVKLLLADGRADPSIIDNFALRLACKEGHIEIVRLLIKDTRVNQSFGEKSKKYIELAASNGDLEIILALLKCKK